MPKVTLLPFRPERLGDPQLYPNANDISHLFSMAFPQKWITSFVFSEIPPSIVDLRQRSFVFIDIRASFVDSIASTGSQF